MVNQARVRTVLRWSHILEGMFLVAYVYSGSHTNVVLTNIGRFVVMPLIVVSGLWLWQQGRIVRWMRRTPSQTSEATKSTLMANRVTLDMTQQSDDPKPARGLSPRASS